MPSLAFISASAISRALWKRFLGFFSSAFITTATTAGGVSGAKSAIGGGGSLTCCMATATGVSPTKGTRPVSISYMTTPVE